MGIKFRKYRTSEPWTEIEYAVKISEKNVEELVAYINKNGGVAINETETFYSDKLKDGEYTAVKMAVKQLVFYKKGVRRAIRKAFAGDFIIRTEMYDLNGKKFYEFNRVKARDFEQYKAA